MSAVVSACARAFCLFSRPAEEEEEEREKCRRWRASIEGIDRAQSFLQSSTSRASPCSVFLPVRVLPHGSYSHAEAHCVLESPPKPKRKLKTRRRKPPRRLPRSRSAKKKPPPPVPPQELLAGPTPLPVPPSPRRRSPRRRRRRNRRREVRSKFAREKRGGKGLGKRSSSSRPRLDPEKLKKTKKKPKPKTPSRRRRRRGQEEGDQARPLGAQGHQLLRLVHRGAPGLRDGFLLRRQRVLHPEAVVLCSVGVHHRVV